MTQHQVWFGTEEALNAHAHRYMMIEKTVGSMALLRHTIRPAGVDLRSCDDDDDWYPNPVTYELVGSVAVLGITGATENSSSWVTRYLGIPTYQDIRDRMVEAYEDQNVKSVLLYLNTPGGHAIGAFGLAEFIENFNKNVKPVFAFTDTQVASGGVLYGTAAAGLFAHEYSNVGSVGAVIMFMDLSGYYKEIKIEPHVIRSAEYKAVPNPYEKLDEKGKSVLQERVDQWHDRFVSRLEINLDISAAQINKTIANGKMFDAKAAVTMGLAQGITTYDKLVATMDKKYQNTNQSAARPA